MRLSLIIFIILISAAGYFAAEQLQQNAGGQLVQPKGNALEKYDLVRVSSPQSNGFIRSPVLVEGKARGYWFFEAVFPVKIADEDGTVLGQGTAHALSDWMTENFVPFQTTVRFDLPSGERGFVILERDNPSGLEENADELRIPVRFAE
ncbi:MAG: Gmad2 immunoglobulin-like domain-containing protein [bacterium]|nr:Gmad2 immunoglobulin-like domain-containing protein [bacterium]